MIVIFATWLNDGTADLDIRCEQCGRWLDQGDLTEITLPALNHLADDHYKTCSEACR